MTCSVIITYEHSHTEIGLKLTLFKPVFQECVDTQGLVQCSSTMAIDSNSQNRATGSGPHTSATFMFTTAVTKRNIKAWVTTYRDQHFSKTLG